MTANANHVTLVRRDVNEFIFPQQTAQRMVGLAHLLAGFDGDGEVVAVLEAEADEGVRQAVSEKM